MGFIEGTLPVRYLGVPLITTKLKFEDCKPLIERIITKVKSWTNKALSYAGRVQLVKSILFSMQVYWSSLFILPKKVCAEVERVLRAFLWTGVALKSTGAKIAWDSVCLPKSEGGLGIKNMGTWNRAAIAKHIWFLFTGGQQSLWCQWVKAYLLRGRSFWMVKIPQDSAWAWRKILQLRPMVRNLLKHRIGNGESTDLWFDNWHPVGPIILAKGERVIYDAALGVKAKVSDIIRGNQWYWPPAQTIDLIELRRGIPDSMIPNTSDPDKVTWLPSSNGMFTVAATWEYIRARKDKVDWCQLIWFYKHIPRYSVIVWMAIKERLNTKDRLLQVGIMDGSCCVLCQQEAESHDHLFFECKFASQIWTTLKRKCNVNWPDLKWLDTISFLSYELQGKSLHTLICKLSLSSAVYAIWKERNGRIFQREQRDLKVVLDDILFNIRGRVLTCRKLKRSMTNLWLKSEWNLAASIFIDS